MLLGNLLLLRYAPNALLPPFNFPNNPAYFAFVQFLHKRLLCSSPYLVYRMNIISGYYRQNLDRSLYILLPLSCASKRETMAPIRVIQFGLGAMGRVMASLVLQKRDMRLVAAIDRNPENKGKDLGLVLGLKKKTGIIVTDNAEEIFSSVQADAMVHAAVSYVPKVWEQIKPAVKRGISVVTIAEEMGYPWVKYPQLCAEMDQVAKAHDARILGSGINPGFAMDLIPLLLTGICRRVDTITVTRIIDFSPFGASIQKNIGIGSTPQEFKVGVKIGKLPLHIGLPESAYMIASGLQWKIDKVEETRDPVLAKKPIRVPGYMTVKKGNVSGFNHRCFAYHKGKNIITLEELGRVDPREDYRNIIKIEGDPKLLEWINVPPGHITTTSHAVNLVPALLKAAPGLRTMLDLPVAPLAPVR